MRRRAQTRHERGRRSFTLEGWVWDINCGSGLHVACAFSLPCGYLNGLPALSDDVVRTCLDIIHWCFPHSQPFSIHALHVLVSSFVKSSLPTLCSNPSIITPSARNLPQPNFALLKSISGCCFLKFSSISSLLCSSLVGFPISF